MIRTADRYRANADPLEYSLWPHERDKLLNDLWALALAHLNELSAHEAKVNREADLTGRNLEPWKAILAVASFLTDRGVTGLWDRVAKLSRDYQGERQGFESGDLTALVVRALCACLGSDVSDVNDVSDVMSKDERPEFLQTGKVSRPPGRLRQRRNWITKQTRLRPANWGAC